MSTTDSDDLQCDVSGCETQVLGLNDGWEFSRGLVCSDCIDFNKEHNHWPDEECGPTCEVPQEDQEL